jgi:hypothetical protein
MAALLELIPRWSGGYHQEGWVPAELPVFELALLFALTMYLWETYLDSRQKARLEAKGGVVPPALGALVKTLDAEALKRGKDAPKKAAELNGASSADAAAKKEDDDKKKDDKIEDGKALEKMTADAPKFQVSSRFSIAFLRVVHFGFPLTRDVPYSLSCRLTTCRKSVSA